MLAHMLRLLEDLCRSIEIEHLPCGLAAGAPSSIVTMLLRARKRSTPEDIIILAGGASLFLSLAVALVKTWMWPVVGDAALMRYIVFLLRNGAVPYRQIVDINYPGSYFFEALGMSLFGAGARGLRLYDWSLLGITGLGCLALTGRRRLRAAIFAACLFALVHLQDGVAQQGQRDLLLAALMIWAVAGFRQATESKSGGKIRAALFVFALVFGCTFVIKPVFVPLVLILWSYALWERPELRSTWSTVTVMTGLSLPWLMAALWLERQDAFASFLSIAHNLGLLHASLGRRPFAFLIGHCLSPVGLLLVCWIVLIVLDRSLLKGERSLLVLCFFGTLFAYVVQGKGFPYQRYPFLIVVLVVVGLTFDAGLERAGATRNLALAGILVGCGCLAPWFAWKAIHFDVSTPFETALGRQLESLAGGGSLAGQVQCLDTFGGCTNTLYDLRLQQSTGFLYDCYLFTAPGRTREVYRTKFLEAFQRSRPRFLVITSQNCFVDLHDGYGRIDTWPELATLITTQFHEIGAWTPSRPVSWFSRQELPSSYRILERTGPTATVPARAIQNQNASKAPTSLKTGERAKSVALLSLERR